MSLRRLVLAAALCAVGCGSVPRFVLHPVGRGFDLQRLEGLHARYERPILVIEGSLYVPDWGCVCERGLVVEGAELVDPQSDRLLEDVVAAPVPAVDGGRPVAVPTCYREADDLDAFVLEGEFGGTIYVFDGDRLLPVVDRRVPLTRGR